METKRVFSGAPWEELVSYCRAIKKGPFIAVSGTAPIKDGQVFGRDDARTQTLRCLEIIENALKEFGLTRADVIRTRMFVIDISKWEDYGLAHGEFFRGQPPATSMVEVKALIDPHMMIEIEADAIAGS